MSPNRPATVGIMIFDEVEVLDFCGPFEVFATTTADGGADSFLFRVLTIAPAPTTVRCVGGLLVQPHYTLADHPPLDILVVPGGAGTRREVKNSALLTWIADQHRRIRLTTSVCTGAYLLAAAGVLDGKRATTHWAFVDRLRAEFPMIDVRANERVVDDGAIVTSAGVSAGIDMALHVVARLHGLAVSRETARQMEYETEGGRRQAVGPAME